MNLNASFWKKSNCQIIPYHTEGTGQFHKSKQAINSLKLFRWYKMLTLNISLDVVFFLNLTKTLTDFAIKVKEISLDIKIVSPVFWPSACPVSDSCPPPADVTDLSHRPALSEISPLHWQDRLQPTLPWICQLQAEQEASMRNNNSSSL